MQWAITEHERSAILDQRHGRLDVDYRPCIYFCPKATVAVNDAETTALRAPTEATVDITR
jgi:hypothetical protein